MAEKLKNCPFCGGEAELKVNQDNNIKQVVCQVCGASNLWSYFARENWNKRTRKDTSLKPCPNCGYKGRLFEAYDSTFCVQCSHCGLTSDHFTQPGEAKVAWNRRPQNDRDVH